MLSATGTRRCVCQKFHHPTVLFCFKEQPAMPIAYYKSKADTYFLQIFQQNIFIFSFILIKLVFK